MSTTITSENAKCYLIALRELKILVTGIISIVIVVIVVVISFVLVVIGIGYLVLEVDVSSAPFCIVFDTNSLASTSVNLPVFTSSLIKLFSLASEVDVPFVVDVTFVVDVLPDPVSNLEEAAPRPTCGAFLKSVGSLLFSAKLE